MAAIFFANVMASESSGKLTHMPDKPLPQKKLDELERIGQVSLEELNQLVEDNASVGDIEEIYEELEQRQITVIDSAPASQSHSEKSHKKKQRKTAAKGDARELDEVLESLADLETLMQRWDAIAAVEREEEDRDDEDNEEEIKSSLAQFMDRVGPLPLLSEAKEQELLRRVREGDEREADAARQKLLESNQRLVLSLAEHYVGRAKLPLQDLVQEGTLGLVRAIDNFGAERKGRLSSYATWWIRRSIRKAIRDNARSVRLPGEFYASIRELQTQQAALTQELGRRPSLDELAKSMEMPLSKVEVLLRASRSTASLEQPVGEDSELGESLRSDENLDGESIFTQDELRGELELALATLPERERVILEKRYGIGDYEDDGDISIHDVAREFNISVEKARQLEKRALRKLRRRSKSTFLEELLD